MALYGVIADIHGNREGLEVALDALAARGVERLLCLGDLIGYNADPDECVALLRARGVVSIAGNHDLIALGKLSTRRCSGKAAHSLANTRKRLAAETRSYLAGLPPHLTLEEGIVLVHGGVRDVQQYMVNPRFIAENAAYLRADFPGARLCFFGHSHEQKVYRVDGEAVVELPLAPRLHLSRDCAYFVNPGSVDASRKRDDKRAECAILDTAAWSVEFLRLPYDAASTEAKAAAFGYRVTPLAEQLHRLRRRLARVARLQR